MTRQNFFGLLAMSAFFVVRQDLLPQAISFGGISLTPLSRVVPGGVLTSEASVNNLSDSVAQGIIVVCIEEFPTGQKLQQDICSGLPVYGMDAVGEGKDSEASNRLIATLDKFDPRPLWVPVWGGPNVLAQALCRIKATRTVEKLDRIVSKLRVYAISDQDDSGPWLRQEFPKLFYIVSPGFNAGGAYHHATWSGITGDYFHGDLLELISPW